ncbi:MAG: hydroxymethylglutaryl-CoA reductase, degradative [Desulfobacterales bacterium]|nr:hydroxymethylglutaryl-CoA reductase, degradative [Desulfobacterales bacterium]
MIQYDYPKLYKRSVAERLNLLESGNVIDHRTSETLLTGQNLLSVEAADRMIENVVGVFGLPIGLGLNFLINGKKYIVPMVVEEPSIVAAVSSAAKTVQKSGGFSAMSSEMLMIGQIAISGIADPQQAEKDILAHKEEILSLANSLHPRMVARGGGAVDIEVNHRRLNRLRTDLVIVHLLVDTSDAMGANLVNSMCEGVAALIEKICGGEAFMQILSNYYDHSIVRVNAFIPPEFLAGKGFSGEKVRDRIVMAGEFAEVDPHRAATHNKGIMNGIDAVALATGNDWRAIEAAAHAHASRESGYRSLTNWSIDASGRLVGSLELPIKVGIVGGSLQSNPAVKTMLKILNVESARELAEVMAAVGLAQNFAALRALVTEGIQQGHMTLHARSVAASAGAAAEQTDQVVEKLIASGDIKVWKAQEIVAELQENSDFKGLERDKPNTAVGNGKVVLLGEHAAVHGRHALALPLSQTIEARVDEGRNGIQLVVPRWGIDTHWMPKADHRMSTYRAIDRILSLLKIDDPAIRIMLSPQVPRAVGLGSSAASAVAVIRALSRYFKLDLDDGEVNRIAYESEKILHGMPSGIDNTVATYANPILFRGNNPPSIQQIDLTEHLPLVVGYSDRESLTAAMVAKVSSSWLNNMIQYESWFDEIDRHALSGWQAIRDFDLERLGELMNANHRILNALEVVGPDQNEMVQIAQESGALGAKMTGGGGGGAIVALSKKGEEARVAAALESAGYKTLKPTADLDEDSGIHSNRAETPITRMQKPEDRLIVVNEKDEILQFLPRSECHAGEGLLHRAFSIHIINDQNQILLQRRSDCKQLWPLFWSNSCCSHPRAGEITIKAAERRLTEELGITARLEFLYKFRYQARFDETGSENEMCSVYLGRSNGPVLANAAEVAEWRFVDPEILDTEIRDYPERFTPWFKMQWEELRQRLLVDSGSIVV